MGTRLKWVLGLLLLVMSAPAYGVDFETLVGETIPSPYSANFKSYFKDQLIPARLAECVSVDRPTTYYVDSSVGSTGAGTLAAPLKQITDVNTVIAASSGYINILFRTGKTWDVTTPLLIDGKNGVKISTYTTDNVYTPPLLTCFSTAATGSWTSNSDSGSTNDGVATYYRTLASEPGWLVENTSDWTRLTPFRYRDSLADCQATSRSFFWDSGASRLYIHYSADPASVAFAYSLESNADEYATIEVKDADLTLVEGIRVEGNGATALTNQSFAYGIFALGTMGRLVVRDCQSYYGGNHVFGSIGGGQVLWQRCRGGYCANTTGSTTFVFFDDAFASTDECIYDECECIAGHLPHETTSTSLSSVHTGFYSHHGTSGDCGLIAVVDCTEPPPLNVTNATATYGSTTLNDVAGSSTLSTMRALWISHKIDRPLARCYHGTKEDNAFLGCLWRTAFDTSDTGSFNIGSSAVGGTFANCIFDFIDYRVTTQRQLIYATTQRYANCSFHLNGNPANGFYIWPVGSGTPYAGDCVVSKTGAKQVLNGIGATSDYNGDAYWGRTATFGVTQATDHTGWADLSAQVKLTSPLYAGQSPIGTLAETGASTSGPRWDYNWQERPDSGGSLGAIEANPKDTADMETILARLGPWTGDTANNSVLGGLRALANSEVGFDSPDLISDLGDGVGNFVQTDDSIRAFSQGFSLTFFREAAGAATGGTSSTMTLDVGSSATNDEYNGCVIVNAVTGEQRIVTGYVGSTKVATVSPNWTTTPSVGNLYFLLRGTPQLLTTSERNATADALLDRANGIETGYTLRGVLRLLGAALAGKTTTSTGTTTFRNLPDTKTRITTTISGGNRTTQTLDVTD